ncbi:hypothetical protein QR98_0014970 [Sarcoptes scabiei]|uniref:Uncharacterized protein n=1 Tax=Sarcoptes scabiei TaxID=52283 RepID=A0A131ZWN5_SARSC|nr:hypothetical protein QR98_0014970 [Sarcoptes scabiei]
MITNNYKPKKMSWKHNQLDQFRQYLNDSEQNQAKIDAKTQLKLENRIKEVEKLLHEHNRLISIESNTKKSEKNLCDRDDHRKNSFDSEEQLDSVGRESSKGVASIQQNLLKTRAEQINNVFDSLIDLFDDCKIDYDQNNEEGSENKHLIEDNRKNEKK